MEIRYLCEATQDLRNWVQNDLIYPGSEPLGHQLTNTRTNVWLSFVGPAHSDTFPGSGPGPLNRIRTLPEALQQQWHVGDWRYC